MKGKNSAGHMAKMIAQLLASIIVCQGAGAIGTLFTRRAIPEWYAFINKPSFNPPNWVFAPVWTSLYALMGIAAFLVWRTGLTMPGVKAALGVFIVQLALNSLWSIVFFGMRSLAGGMAVIVLLWLAIAWTMKRFLAVSRPAAALLFPSIAWVSFALVLNAGILIANK